MEKPSRQVRRAAARRGELPPKSRSERLLAWFAGLPKKAKTAIATAEFAGALTAMGVAWSVGGDMTLVIIALVVGWLLAAVGIATIQNVSVKNKTIGAVVTALFLCGEGGFLQWHFRPVVVAPTPPASQSEFLLSLNNWLCSKDEWALRTEFDLIGMLQSNIDLMTQNYGPLNEKQKRLAKVFVTSDHVQLVHPPAAGSQYQSGDWSVRPGEVGILILTDKYSRSSDRLDDVVGSALMPPDVKKHLNFLQESIKMDKIIAIEELNNSYKSDPKLIFDAKKAGTPSFAVVLDKYALEMVPLRPSVDAACDAVGKHLRSVN